MNERIRELFLQAGFHPPVARRMGNEYKFEIFTQLIVRECIEAIQNKSMNSSDEWEDGLVIAESAIKEHFGVKE